MAALSFLTSQKVLTKVLIVLSSNLSSLATSQQRTTLSIT